MPDSDHCLEPWGLFLHELDAIATESVEFHCIGGFVITSKYGFQRETADVDILPITVR